MGPSSLVGIFGCLGLWMRALQGGESFRSKTACAGANTRGPNVEGTQLRAHVRYRVCLVVGDGSELEMNDLMLCTTSGFCSFRWISLASSSCALS